MTREGARTVEALLQKTCVPCSGDSLPVSEAEIAELQPQIPNWKMIEENGESHLQRVYNFPDFQTALAFTQLVGEEADKQGHHPALLTEWGKVTVTWWTHAIQALHRNDFIMAAKTDDIATGFTN
nr:4a-hydroxytetrahydrobiopterin dehydratase [Nostoc sp. JL31]